MLLLTSASEKIHSIFFRDKQKKHIEGICVDNKHTALINSRDPSQFYINSDIIGHDRESLI